MTDEITPLLALAILVGPAVGGVALMMRVWAVDALQALGLFEKLGKPRRVFFTDLLAFKLLFLRDTQVRSPHRAVFVMYFVFWIIGCISCLVAFWEIAL